MKKMQVSQQATNNAIDSSLGLVITKNHINKN